MEIKSKLEQFEKNKFIAFPHGGNTAKKKKRNLILAILSIDVNCRDESLKRGVNPWKQGWIPGIPENRDESLKTGTNSWKQGFFTIFKNIRDKIGDFSEFVNFQEFQVFFEIYFNGKLCKSRTDNKSCPKKWNWEKWRRSIHQNCMQNLAHFVTLNLAG